MKVEQKQLKESFKLNNSKDLDEIMKLAASIGIITVKDLDRFMQEPENENKDVLTALRDWKVLLGPDFQLAEKLEEDIRRTYMKGSEEYQKLQNVVDMLNKAYGSDNYYLKDTYLDFGLNRMWTTIINKDKGYQVLCPRDFVYILEDNEEGIKNVFEQEKLTLPVLEESIDEQEQLDTDECNQRLNSLYKRLRGEYLELLKEMSDSEAVELISKGCKRELGRTLRVSHLDPEKYSFVIDNFTQALKSIAKVLEGQINFFDNKLEEGFSRSSFFREMTLTDLLDKVKVNGPQYRGAEKPEAVETAINEIDIPDNMRFKSYDFDVPNNKAATFTWITQEPFDEADVQKAFTEFERAISAIAKNKEFNKPFNITVNITARDGEAYGHATKKIEFNKVVTEAVDNSLSDWSGDASVKSGYISVEGDKTVLTYSDLVIEDVPYGQQHDYSYYKEPYYDTTDVDMSDFEYTIDTNEVIEFLYDQLDESDYKQIDDIDNNEEVDKYIKEHLDSLLKKHGEALMDSYEDDAREDAFEEACEIADDRSYGYDEKLHESINVDEQGQRKIITDALNENGIEFSIIDNKIIIDSTNRSILSVISKALTANDIALVDFDSNEDEELFVYSERVTLPNTDEVESRGNIFVTVVNGQIIIMFTADDLSSIEINESITEDEIVYDDIDISEQDSAKEYAVTYYERYPVYHSEEGGYCQECAQILSQDKFNTLEEARNAFDELVDKLGLTIAPTQLRDYAESEPLQMHGYFVQIESDTDDLFEDISSAEKMNTFYQ